MVRMCDVYHTAGTRVNLGELLFQSVQTSSRCVMYDILQEHWWTRDKGDLLFQSFRTWSECVMYVILQGHG